MRQSRGGGGGLPLTELVCFSLLMALEASKNHCCQARKWSRIFKKAQDPEMLESPLREMLLLEVESCNLHSGNARA